MFKKARIKLTGWYLLIIMAISLSFSGAIYAGVNGELTRMYNAQKERQARVENLRQYLRDNSLPLPPEKGQPELESIEQARTRIITALGIINLSILILSGLGGYFLAGLTLDPISKMVKEQKEFVGNASHELRTPLTSLKTQIEVALRDKKLNLKDAKSLLKSNLDDVNGMYRLSNYLLELSKFDNFQTNFEFKNINLAKIVDNLLDSFIPIAVKKKNEIVKDLKISVIKGDEQAVIELTSILIDNAIKYSGNGKKIKVKVEDGELSVKDFGIGISGKDLPHIFERFYRADASRSKGATEGYGLGLSIAKSICDKVGGKISVESTLGKGTAFIVKFPSV